MSYEDLNVNQVENFVKQPGAVVIDVRDIHTYRAGHMQGALHIDGPAMGGLIRKRKSNPPILVYCYHGNLSREMADMISRLGFTNVSHLVGGWEAWANYQLQPDKNTADYSNDLVAGFA